MTLKFRNDEEIGWREKLIIVGPVVVIAIGISLFIYYFEGGGTRWLRNAGSG